jgi:DNA mismatch repair protein, C-terminal domain
VSKVPHAAGSRNALILTYTLCFDGRHRLLRVLQGYALISVGVRLTVTNTAAGKGPSRLIATQSNARLEDNVSNIFGAKTLAGLQPLTVEIAEEEGDDTVTAATVTAAVTDAADAVADQIAEVAQKAKSRRRITGLVSKVGEGVGRSDNDRQFIFLNGRPVDLPKVGRVLNEVRSACITVYMLQVVTPKLRNASVAGTAIASLIKLHMVAVRHAVIRRTVVAMKTPHVLRALQYSYADALAYTRLLCAGVASV